jgi:hypothetical protein
MTGNVPAAPGRDVRPSTGVTNLVGADESDALTLLFRGAPGPGRRPGGCTAGRRRRPGTRGDRVILRMLSILGKQGTISHQSSISSFS